MWAQSRPIAERMAHKPIHMVEKLFDKMVAYKRAEEDRVPRADKTTMAAASKASTSEKTD